MCLQGLQIYSYSSLAKRQINLIRAQPSRENFEGSRVQLRNTWGQLTSEPPLKEYFLPLPWAELAAHQQHLQMQVSQDEDKVCAAGELMVCRNRGWAELVERRQPNIKPQAQAAKEEAKNEPDPHSIGNQTMLRALNEEQRCQKDFLAVGKAE